MNFTKVHGLGNDFVVVNALQEVLPADLAVLARAICDRHFGIGADGLVLLLPAENPENHLRMRIFNPDGSEPEMCGNAIRCFARLAWEEGLVKDRVIRVETLAGVMVPEVVLGESGQVRGIRVDMGEPILERNLIPMQGPAGTVVNELLQVGEYNLHITAVSMGNPHAVTFVPDLTHFPWQTVGPLLESHPAFPRKVNAEFVQVINRREMIMRVWERGAGPTLACGTGACATLVAAVLNDLTERKATIHLAGGDLEIEWDASTNHVFMTGPATIVFTGKYQVR